jgi:hypothetical protein
MNEQALLGRIDANNDVYEGMTAQNVAQNASSHTAAALLQNTTFQGSVALRQVLRDNILQPVKVSQNGFTVAQLHEKRKLKKNGAGSLPTGGNDSRHFRNQLANAGPPQETPVGLGMMHREISPAATDEEVTLVGQNSPLVARSPPAYGTPGENPSTTVLQHSFSVNQRRVSLSTVHLAR